MKVFLFAFGFVVTSMAIAACADLTGPKSPETPINVTATMLTSTSVRVTWSPSPQSGGVVSYNILRNGTKVGESTTTSYTDTGLAEQTTYKYTVSANCTSGLLSEPSPESPAATVTTIDATPPRVIANTPANGSTIVSTFATVTVTFSEPMDPASINTTTFNLKVTSSGAAIPGTVTYTAATRVAEFKPTSQLPSQTNFTATVTTGAKDLAGNGLATPFSFAFTTIDQTPPTITATSPANGANGVSVTAPITVTFSEAMDPATINNTTITLRVTAGGAAVAGTVTYNATTHVATFTPNNPLNAPVNYTATVSSSVKDVAGNPLGVDVSFSFTTGDTTAPTVVSTVPANLATNVPNNVVLSATFSEAMDPTTINTSTFGLRVTATSAPVSGTVAYNAATNTATFTPSAPLASGTTYTAIITTGAKDLSGNGLSSNFSWTFITVDTAPPTVTAVSPANSAINVPVNTVVNITFSEPMDPATINATTITLRNTNTSAAVTGTVTYNTATNVATFTPNVPLANGTGYTLTVTTGVKDLAGNAMLGNFNSTFTTVSAVDTIPPTVIARTPTGNSVPNNAIVTVTFSEPMNAATINTSTILLNEVGGSPTPLAATVSYNAATNTATLSPTALLKSGKTYQITVTVGVKDVAGNAMAAPFTAQFDTAPDTTPPTVIARTPTAATGVPVNTTVTVTFSEDMDPTTINTTTFSLAVSGGGAAVTGTVSYNQATRVATFTPSAPLSPSTGYTATVTTDARDLGGNGLTGNFAFSFTTAP